MSSKTHSQGSQGIHRVYRHSGQERQGSAHHHERGVEGSDLGSADSVQLSSSQVGSFQKSGAGQEGELVVVARNAESTPITAVSVLGQSAPALRVVSFDGVTRFGVDARGLVSIVVGSEQGVPGADTWTVLSAERRDMSAAGPVVSLGHNRAASGFAPLMPGDQLGAVGFFGSDVADYKAGAYIVALVDGTVFGSVPGRLEFHTAPAGGFPVPRVVVHGSGTLDTKAGLARSGVLTSPLFSHANDWNPAGLDGASVVRVATDAVRNITGIVAPVVAREVRIVNIGVFALQFLHEDPGSAAVNRFICPGNLSQLVGENMSVDVWYDQVSQRWRVIG